MNLIYKLKNEPCFNTQEKHNIKKRNTKFKDNLVNTLNLIVGSPENNFLLTNLSKFSEG